MVALGIRFNDCLFSEPVRLADWEPLQCGALYVVLAPDLTWAPKPFQPLYFGEFGNNSSRSAVLSSVAELLAPHTSKPLFVAVFPMPFSTTQQRWAVRNELIWAYNPPSQEDRSKSPASELVQKLDELERINREQSAQLLQLRASAGRFLEPPEPRRRIGFLPFIDPGPVENRY